MLLVVGSIALYIQSYKINDHTIPKTCELTKDNNSHRNPTKAASFKARDFCEIIHIGVVCSGFHSNLYFHALLKSLLLTRSNPIHFHLLVSSESDKVLKLLFKTWQLPQVNISFYNVNLWLKDVRWVPNGHYSGNYGLLKLIFNKVVPSTVTKKLLVLDTDLIINDDIYWLWKLLDDFNHKQAIGIAENQSPYYLGQLNQARPWPALGMGFNSGVMLYDLSKLNAMKWDNIWVNLTKRYTLVYGQADLGDQDIINSVIKENQEIVYKLPCYWNTQMSGYSTSSNCYKEFKPKILHWNSPRKYSVGTKDGEIFRGLAKSVFDLNGNWFRKYPQLCEDDTQIVLNIESPDVCHRFSKPSDVLYRTLLFFLDYKFIADDWDITYVTHLSFDRIHLLESIARIWTGPMSFTFYVTDAELARAMEIITESDVLKTRTDIAYHAVFKQGEFYPTNILRNTGLKYVKTPYSFLVDVDFIPMKSLFEILKDNIKSIGDLNKKALVVPAFETTHSNVPVPTSKIQLIELLEKNDVRQFLAEVWPAGHAPTDYEKWRREYEPYQVKWRAHYEPYIVVKSNVVRYDERFLGFGWNKVSHIMELEAQRYEFIILSDVFIIHESHSVSCDNFKYRQSPLYRKCIQLLKRRFLQELYKKYNRNFTDINFDDYIRRKRRKRGTTEELTMTTTMYESTDYFLSWGGKEKANRKKELRKSFSKPQNKEKASHETLKLEYDYYYYDSEYPYNLTVVKVKPNETKFNTKIVNISTSEEHDYEYDEDDLKFKRLHDSTTVPYVEGATILGENDLVSPEKDFESVIVDEKLKNSPH